MKRVLSLRQKSLKQRGVIAVELALVLPLLVWIILGIVDLGLMSRQHQVIQNAAREGARYSSLPRGRIDAVANPGFTLSDLKAIVIAYAAREGVALTEADITVNQGHTLTSNGLLVTASRITASRSYQYLTPGMATLLGSINLVGEGIYKNLWAS